MEVDQIEQRRLDELTLNKRPLDADQRLGREDKRAFRDRIDLAAEGHGLQRVKKCRVEQGLAIRATHLGQKGGVFRLEPKMAQKIHHILKATGDAEAAPKRIVTEEQVEDGFPVCESGLPIAIRHGELVEIGQQSQGGPVQPGRNFHDRVAII